MKVTEKCDVYSFEVVALEVMMGKHPRDLLSSLPLLSGKDILVKEMLDQRLTPPTGQLAEEVVSRHYCSRTNGEDRRDITEC
ncbi:hypothetical protein KFK09_019266 [Dendrobium nobile]|uniref:non-specific serine/threonine protein kinase n=1 Tax=Dendrobium nobile TaxID=94219 RepID=A0A8T3AYL9_DENNO|nr:hypothetical protein KFK09_019266 [Dendrobium nobile]